MVSYYSVFGQKIGSHYLAIATLTTFFGSAYAFSGGKKTPAAGNLPPINASSSDEADFIKKFLEQSETEEKKAKH
ncbi:hypothetical protein GQ53DRAFT_741159 [Thozetella sp. PMI_491]|nr:hypothetical protein GQ53DRAFT_741159 [Thozetella sp. PMI_491]